MRWGFAWEIGPFEISKMFKGETAPAASFIKKQHVIKQNPGASLRDLGDGVACLEFHSKMNTIGNDIISLLFTSLEEVNANFEGLVIGNEGQNFSAGANLMLLMMEAVEGNWDEIDHMVRTFQRATQAIRYNPKPSLSRLSGLTLGGGCEIAMAGARPGRGRNLYGTGRGWGRTDSGRRRHNGNAVGAHGGAHAMSAKFSKISEWRKSPRALKGAAASCTSTGRRNHHEPGSADSTMRKLWCCDWPRRVTARRFPSNFPFSANRLRRN